MSEEYTNTNIISMLALTANAGSGTAVLTCISASGKTEFKAYLQDIIGGLEGAAFTIEGTSL